jgi:hypothetical protein
LKEMTLHVIVKHKAHGLLSKLSPNEREKMLACYN